MIHFSAFFKVDTSFLLYSQYWKYIVFVAKANKTNGFKQSTLAYQFTGPTKLLLTVDFSCLFFLFNDFSKLHASCMICKKYLKLRKNIFSVTFTLISLKFTLFSVKSAYFQFSFFYSYDFVNIFTFVCQHCFLNILHIFL